MPGRLLAVPPAGLVTRPDGRDGVDPVTGQPAVWIHADGREVAELAGCRVLEAAAVVAGHFGEIVADHADELLTREQVERLLERVRATAPTLVGEVVPGPAPRRRAPAGLAEPAPRAGQHSRPGDDPRDAGRARRPDQGHRCLTEQVRRSLARQITESYRGPDGRLRVVTLARPLDARLAAAGSQAETRPAEALGDDTARSIIRAVAVAVGTLIENGYPAGDPHLARGPCRPQGPDPRRPAAAGRPQPARDPARYAGRGPRQRRRGRARGRDHFHASTSRVIESLE